MMDLEAINTIKKLTITSLMQDEDLMESLVLKGGNAISLGYGLEDRASYDLDFSLEEDFADIMEIQRRLEKAMVEGFAINGLVVFDLQIMEKPKTQDPDLQPFWGGYILVFKVISTEKYKKYEGDIELMRRNAISLNPDNSTKFKVDISKFEYVGDHKKMINIDGVYFYIYAPELIVFEKIRALAQKLPEYYRDVLKQDRLRAEDDRARARDFFDIYEIMENFNIDLKSADSLETLRHVFEAKRVPKEYLRKIRSMEEIHRQGYQAVIDTISNKAKDRGFDFYFQYFLENFEHLMD
jgi:predicted nucleotidyltransferase component of viral defense system